MDNEKQFLEFVGTASERAGALAGKVASIGNKITSLATGSISTGKEMLGLADKKVIHKSEKKSDNTKISILKSDLAAAQRKLTNTEKTQSKLESQIKELKTENHSLVSQMDQMRSELSETKSRESAVRARAAALESELDDIRSQLEETQSKPAKTTAVGVGRSKRVAELESELAAARQELAETQNQAEHAQIELKKQLVELQAENKSLISELDQARKEADDAGIRADSIESKIATLESNVSDAHLKSEEESGIDITLSQTDYQNEPAVVPTTEEIEPLIESDVIQDELIDADVENVEVPEPEPEPILESDTEIDVEEIEPEPLPEVELTGPVKVTAEDVQASDFKNEAERIIFTKALSDFVSADTAARVDAAKTIGGISHELSARVIVAHIADEKSAAVRKECIKALSTLEMAEGLSAVESALKDETASIRLAAVWGIYRLAGIESLPKLLAMLSDGDVSVRRRAVTCIGWLGGQLRTIGGSQLRRVISALIECLNDSAESMRKATLDALQAVTGNTISIGKSSPERLIDQWRIWWKEELLN